MLWPLGSCAPAALRRAAAALLLTFVMALPAALVSGSEAQPTRAELEARNRQIKQVQAAQMMEGARQRLHEARARAAYVRWLKKHGKPGAKVREVNPESEEMRPPRDVSPVRMPAPDAATSTLAVPTNVRANNTAGDGAGSGQAEEAIASFGNNVLVAWNDGQGFIPPTGDIQGYAYSTDGGATFTDGGTPPHLGGWPAQAWYSDPVVTVNDKTGEFYYCGLVLPSGTTNGVGVIRATFPGGVFTWDTPRLAVTYNNATASADKQWIAADSSNGNLYVTWTRFSPLDSIMFSRSTNNGVSWSPALTMSSPAGAGNVQGSRPAVGPNGEVYVTWSEIGPVDVDFYQFRKSTNAGVSFTPEVTAVSEFSNFGTGAPGFNRERGIYFPSIAVDRTTGTNRGRIYLSWSETVNWYDDALGGGGNKSEGTDANNFFATATLFTPNNRLRGAINSTTDGFDYWKFSATQGTTYIFWADSIGSVFYTMRVFCTDTLTRLAYSGHITASPNTNSFIVWTAPTTATYYLRMAFVSGSGTSGGYRIQTGTNSTPGLEPGRDTRDIMVNYSDDGTTWSTPVRVNDDPGYLDDWLPEVAVAADGCPYIVWYDWRDAPGSTCGGQSHTYISRSDDGGGTWVANQRISSAITPWTSVSSNIAPNQGDYMHMYGDSRYLHPTWADGRLGTPDVWTTSIDTYHDITVCQNDTTGYPDTNVLMGWIVANRNPAFDNTYTYSIASQRSWPMPSSGSLPVTAGGTNTLPLSVAVPDTAAEGVNQLCLNVTNAKGTLVRQCCTNLTVLPNVGVGDNPLSFALHPSIPNPGIGSARINFNVPQNGRVKLVIYGLRGERVRTLVDGERAAGPNSVLWDGRNDRGHSVSAGAYFYRLEGFGQNATRRLVFMP